jgi:hypothetical protein
MTYGRFFLLLSVLSISLKLAGFINWSWFWVLTPVWIPIVPVLLVGAFYIAGIVVLLILASLFSIQDALRKKVY